MKKTTLKALYLFMCAILGMVLFAMLHRAIFVIYDLMLALDFRTYSFGIAESSLMAIDFLSMLVALFLGGWYGTALGIDWYAMVYGPNSTVQAGLFHAFIPHHFKKNKSAGTAKSVISPSAHSTTVKVPIVEKRVSKDLEQNIEKTDDWSFDDLLASVGASPIKKPAKKVTKKTVAKSDVKTARKTTAKKVKTTSVE